MARIDQHESVDEGIYGNAGGVKAGSSPATAVLY